MTEDSPRGSNPRSFPPLTLAPERAVLLGIDFQQGFGPDGMEYTPGAPGAVAAFRRAAQTWREHGGHVIHVHSTREPEDFVAEDGRADDAAFTAHPMRRGSRHAEFYPGLVDDADTIIRKTAFSAVAGSNLTEVLRARGWTEVIVAGLTTPICVGTTSDALSMGGFLVGVLSDACASQPIGDYSAELMHDVALARFGYLFGHTLTTAEFLNRVGPG
ncbi:MAG TPA: isochorismatase family cysteine hydrolase [Actinomycetaceae bacterium]|nr:isochorismatase family cysteine hydrolase [Actinomycetaceae bacterium]